MSVTKRVAHVLRVAGIDSVGGHVYDVGHISFFGRPFVKGWALYAIGPLSCPVSPVCDVGVYCGQTVGWIKI